MTTKAKSCRGDDTPRVMRLTEILALDHERMTVREIAEVLGWNYARVYRLVRKHDVLVKSGRGPSPRTRARFLQIRKMLFDGKSCAEIAREFNVSRQAIWDLVRKHRAEIMEKTVPNDELERREE